MRRPSPAPLTSPLWVRAAPARAGAAPPPLAHLSVALVAASPPLPSLLGILATRGRAATVTGRAAAAVHHSPATAPPPPTPTAPWALVSAIIPGRHRDCSPVAARRRELQPAPGSPASSAPHRRPTPPLHQCRCLLQHLPRTRRAWLPPSTRWLYRTRPPGSWTPVLHLI